MQNNVYLKKALVLTYLFEEMLTLKPLLQLLPPLLKLLILEKGMFTRNRQ